MDPVSAFGVVTGGFQVLQAIASTVQGLKQLYGKFKDADLTIWALICELNSIRTALTALEAWSPAYYHGSNADEFSRNLAMTREGCYFMMNILSQNVADLQQGAQPDTGMGLRIRMKVVWNDEMMKEHQGMLRGQVQALNLLLQVYQCTSPAEKSRLLGRPEARQIMSKVADSTEVLRSHHGSRVGTDAGGLSRTSSRPPLSHLDFDEYSTSSPVYHQPQPQRSLPRLSLQTQFQSNSPQITRSACSDEGYASSNYAEAFNIGVSSLKPPPARPRHLSLPNSPSTPMQPPHSRSISYNHSFSSPNPNISRQWHSDSQTFTQAARPSPSKYEKFSAFLGRINTRSRVHLSAISQASSPKANSPNSATSPTMSRDRRNFEVDLSPSIDLTTIDAALVERLIERGCNVDERHIQTGRNALLVASHCGYDAVVALLIRKNAQLAVVDECGATALHLAASRGNCAVLELLINQSELIEATNPDGQTPLRVAADRGQLYALEVLLSHKAKVNSRAERLMTVLHAASKRGDTHVTQLLISHGADIECKDGMMMTALHYACEMGHIEVIALLLDHRAQIESPGPERKAPLICAAGAGMIQAVDLLLKRRATSRAIDDAGMTALHWAAYNGHEDIVQILSQKKSPLLSENHAGQTPLHLATLSSQFAVVELLLRKNAPINSQFNKGLTPLHYACEKKNLEIANLLLLTGADTEASDYEDRQRTLHIAAAQNSPSILNLLCDRKAILDARDVLGDRPLCVASRYGQADAVQRLLERGSPLYYRHENSSFEDSPLCLAAKGGHFAVVSILLEYGASALRKDETGWQPFRYAAYHGHQDVLQLLLSYSNISDIDFPDIMMMPETIGFSTDANISDEKKRQIQQLLAQVFGQLSPERIMNANSHSPSMISQPPTVIQQGILAHKYPKSYYPDSHELETPTYAVFTPA
ncbi:uncharacterized protein N7483_010705 [Penicillium malachiteum]|uniref:uncharacterized protein n=1 Tax=Penicillium malachiteum TaxID=1324776 RepID=UPI002547C2AD|nr:uncharacterized protein N7483_010705 [Penicillium malachiteum]KAJ5713524.1 hypothetical protein N7483_010705 [Penicillium malachiteum]